MTLTQVTKAGLDELALDHVLTVGASGTDHYTFQGEGLNGTVNDPTLYLTRGKTYRFEKGSAHPLRIQSTAGASGTAYNTGVTNNGGTGTVIIEVQHDAPDVLYYQCTSHANMNGILYITGALADDGVTEDKIADNAVTRAKIVDGAINGAKCENQSIGAEKLTAGTIVNNNVSASANIAGSKLADDSISLAKLQHGTSSNDGKFLRANNGADPSFETVDLANLNASNLTSGTVPDARISASSVTQHVTTFDDTAIRHDISMLGLHFADAENKTAFDLANSTIDQMETAASIASNTSAMFDTTYEYWSCASENEVASGITDFPSTSGLSGTVNMSLFTDGDFTNYAFHTDQSGVGTFWIIDLQAQKNISKVRINVGPQVIGSTTWAIHGSNDGNSYTDTGQSIALSGLSGWVEKTGLSLNYRYFKFYKTTGAQGGGYHRELQMYAKTITATGSIISNTYTASSSRTQVAGILLYRDLSGTATLGTDLKVFFSCNNGSNYTEVSSYTALSMAFQTGIKAVTLPKMTCTGGTQIKFKVEWANQSASKETAVQGIALQY